jgi:type II secretory pathway component PulF
MCILMMQSGRVMAVITARLATIIYSIAAINAEENTPERRSFIIALVIIAFAAMIVILSNVSNVTKLSGVATAIPPMRGCAVLIATLTILRIVMVVAIRSGVMILTKMAIATNAARINPNGVWGGLLATARPMIE